MEELINKIEKIFVYDKEKFNNIRNIFEKKEFKKIKDENKEYEMKFTQEEMTIILNSLKYHKDQTTQRTIEKEIIKQEPEIIKEEKSFNIKMEFWRAKEKENEKEEPHEDAIIKKKKKSKKGKEECEKKKKKKKRSEKISEE
jgi:hypothetical protein